MKTFSTWAYPVAVSLLFHAALLVLLTHRLAAGHADSSRMQTMTVSLLAQTPQKTGKPHKLLAKPAAPAKPVLPSNSADAPAITSPAPEESPTLKADTQQADTPTAETHSQAANSLATEANSSAVQPLGKLSRPPAFLRKIEPLYPVAEQRAGGQANVLAEVTIDENGKVLEIRIAKSAGKHFDDAVIEALKNSQFVPGYIDQQAVAVRVLVPFRFNLR